MKVWQIVLTTLVAIAIVLIAIDIYVGGGGNALYEPEDATTITTIVIADETISIEIEPAVLFNHKAYHISLQQGGVIRWTVEEISGMHITFWLLTESEYEKFVSGVSGVSFETIYDGHHIVKQSHQAQLGPGNYCFVLIPFDGDIGGRIVKVYLAVEYSS